MNLLWISIHADLTLQLWKSRWKELQICEMVSWI
jgi:hypothetical protein